MTNSRRIGKDTELAFCKWLRGWSRDGKPVEARRSQQHMATPDSPDVVTTVPATRFEVSRNSNLRIGSEALRQKCIAAECLTPVDVRSIVAWRRPGGRWMMSFMYHMNGCRILTADAEDVMEGWGYKHG